MFLPQVENIIASRTQILQSKHMFPSLATMKTMLTRFQCCSLKMFPSNGKQTTMADGEVEVEEKGEKIERTRRESYSLLCMTVAGCSS